MLPPSVSSEHLAIWEGYQVPGENGPHQHLSFNTSHLQYLTSGERGGLLFEYSLYIINPLSHTTTYTVCVLVHSSGRVIPLLLQRGMAIAGGDMMGGDEVASIGEEETTSTCNSPFYPSPHPIDDSR